MKINRNAKLRGRFALFLSEIIMNKLGSWRRDLEKTLRSLVFSEGHERVEYFTTVNLMVNKSRRLQDNSDL